jgi:hypothetical protein
MGNINFKMVLSYKGSRDGWTVADFLRKNNKKIPSVYFFRI